MLLTLFGVDFIIITCLTVNYLLRSDIVKTQNNYSKPWQSLIIAFLLTFLFVILLTILGIYVGVFNSRNITRSINKVDYYDKAYDDIRQSMEKILSDTGLSGVELSDIITPSRVHVDGMNYINDAINHKYQPDIMAYGPLKSQSQLIIHEEIKTQILSYIDQDSTHTEALDRSSTALEAQEEQELSDTQEIQESIVTQETQETQELTTTLAALEAQYDGRVQLKFVAYLIRIKSDFQSLMPIIFTGVILLIIIQCIILVRINIHTYRGTKYIIYSLLASSILIFAMALFLLFSKHYTSLMKYPDMQNLYYFRQFLDEFLRLSVSVFVYIGMIGIFAAILSIRWIDITKNRLMNSSDY